MFEGGGIWAFWCIFSCFYINNGVGNQNITVFKRNAFQATQMHEIRLLLITAKNTTISVASLV